MQTFIQRRQWLAGHSQMDTTLHYYTHVADDQLAEAMSRLQAVKA